MVDTTDVIFMDLLGFTLVNKGCAYWVNILLDSVNAERRLFIGYKEDAIAMIQSVIEERWENLSGTSPNLKTENPYSKL